MAVNIPLVMCGKQAQKQADGSAPIVWGTGTGGDVLKLIFLNALPNVDTAEFYSAISGTEITGTNWPAGGIVLAGKSSVLNTSDNTVDLKADPISVADVTISGVVAVALIKWTGSAATSPVYAVGALATTGAGTGGAVNIPWDGVDDKVVLTFGY